VAPETAAAYLGLAIVGAGGAGRFFSHPPLIAVTRVTVELGFAALFSEAHVGSGVREDRSNRWVIAALTALGLIDAYLPAHGASFPAFTEPVREAGCDAVAVTRRLP
jgi:hypothetical protein